MAHDPEVMELDYELFADCQMEHILPQDPSTFDVATFGFTDDEHDESRGRGFGNLTPLEAALNKQALNLPPGDKARVYDGRSSELIYAGRAEGWLVVPRLEPSSDTTQPACGS